MGKRTLAEIEADIASTQTELEHVHGNEAEVYARIVGYYRSVRNWNRGKRDEYNHRKLYVFEDQKTPSEEKTSFEKEAISDEREVVSKAPKTGSLFDEQKDSGLYCEFFSRKTCPNCPPVKAFLENAKTEVVNIDVDSKDGLARATELGVFAAPTVILFNGENEVGRAHSADELASLLKTA